MTAEWKPGDVAMVNGRVCINTGGAWEHGSPLAFKYADHESLDVRPVVVIDPEDREQIELLLRGYWVERDADNPDDVRNYPEYVRDMQAALREFANPTPPKPEEPTGLGAVVKDARGFTYVRGYVPEDDNYPWHVVDPRAALPRGWWRWDDIDAVEVLSEGVTP